MKILVLGGGTSPEKEISLKSAKNVEEGLKRAGFNVLFYDPKDGIDGLIKQSKQVDIVFPILHGLGGEDGEIQTILEKTKVSYLGSNPNSMKKTIDKVLFKKICIKNGIKTPNYEVVDQSNLPESKLIFWPFVLKPIDGGSTIDALIVRKLPPDQAVIDGLMEKYKTMLLEELIDGVEITIGVLGSKTLPAVEIIPPIGGEFDFENKYNGKTQEICPPKNVSIELQRKAAGIALTTHQILGCRHLSRVDMIIRGEDVYVLELNTIPGLTKNSLFPKEALAAGLSFEDLMEEFVKLSSETFEAR